MRWHTKVASFGRLDGSVKVRILEAFLLPGLIWCSFRVAGVGRTQGFLRRWATSGTLGPSGRSRVPVPSEAAEVAIRNTKRAMGIVRRNAGFQGSCLVRSFTLWSMLKKQGVETEVRIGMRRSGGKIEGHAWVEYAGTALNEDAAVVATYSVLPQAAAFDFWAKV